MKGIITITKYMSSLNTKFSWNRPNQLWSALETFRAKLDRMYKYMCYRKYIDKT